MSTRQSLRGLRLRCGTRERLIKLVAAQLSALFPDAGKASDIEMLRAVLPAALEAMRPILASVRAFEPDLFDTFNSLQYTSFLYLLSREASRLRTSSGLSDRLFCLNRAINSVDLYHGVQMPEVFFISHGLGAVLGNVSYGNRLVVFQGVTVGRVGSKRPIIGDNVVLFPGATVSGDSVVGNGSVVGAGVVLHNEVVPPGCVVRVRRGGLEIKRTAKDYASMYFRD